MALIRNQKQLDLLRRVMDGEKNLAPLIYHINLMRRCEEACKYLIRSNLVGKNLLFFWTIECKKSYLEVIQQINLGLDKELREVFVKRDLF